MATQRRTVLFVELKVTFCTNCPVRCTISRSLILSHWTSDPFEFHLTFDQKQLSSCRDLQNFKPVKSDDVQQNFWSSGFFSTWSSESSSLECWRRSSELLSSESSST